MALDRRRSGLTLHYDVVLPYVAADDNRRLLPRLPTPVAVPGNGRRLVTLWPLLDTGAEWTLFDGTVALDLGWSAPEIAARAEDAQPISGVERGAGPLRAYRHRLTCSVPLRQEFAACSLDGRGRRRVVLPGVAPVQVRLDRIVASQDIRVGDDPTDKDVFPASLERRDVFRAQVLIRERRPLPRPFGPDERIDCLRLARAAALPELCAFGQRRRCRVSRSGAVRLCGTRKRVAWHTMGSATAEAARDEALAAKEDVHDRHHDRHQSAARGPRDPAAE